MAHLSIWLLLTLLEKSPPSLTVSSSLRFGVLGNKKVLSFLWVFFKRPRKYYLGSSICLSGIGVSELPISSAASWHLVAHPPWVIDTLPLCFVFFFFSFSWLLGSHLLQPWGLRKWRMPLQPWLGWSKLWAGTGPMPRPVQWAWHIRPRHGPLQLWSQLDGSRLLCW